MTGSVHALVEDLFRRSSAQLVASLTRRLGATRLDLAEEAVQEALARALRLWPHHGVPANPAAWLATAARNRALDLLRQEATAARLLAAWAPPGDASPDVAPALDDELALIFLCAHPAIPEEARIALTLKTAGGFGVREIARAFLLREDAVAQRIVRAKRALRAADVAFELTPADLRARLPAVLAVVYLLFNEGYHGSSGDVSVRDDLCGEALRLAGLLAGRQETALPETHALHALLLLQSSRLAARAGASILLLEEQDRATWDRQLIGRGLRELERAARGETLTSYHLEAGIAAEHAVARSVEETNWPRILHFYDLLLELNPSPVVALNRAVALERVRGAAAAEPVLCALADDPHLATYLPLHLALAHNARARGDAPAAQQHLQRALGLPCSPAERRHLEGLLAAVPAP